METVELVKKALCFQSSNFFIICFSRNIFPNCTLQNILSFWFLYFLYLSLTARKGNLTFFALLVNDAHFTFQLAPKNQE